jgi:hypothetical protein
MEKAEIKKNSWVAWSEDEVKLLKRLFLKMKGRNYGSGISRLYIRWLIPPFTSQSRDVNLARMFPIRFCCELVHRIIFHSHLLKGKPSLLNSWLVPAACENDLPAAYTHMGVNKIADSLDPFHFSVAQLPSLVCAKRRNK